MSVNARTVTSIQRTTVAVEVPDNDIAQLMYYLYCVTKRIGIHILPNIFTDYGNHHTLTTSQRADVIKYALQLSPDLFIGKLIFRDDNRRVCTRFQNDFVTLTTACNFVVAQRSVVIAGETRDVTQVMFFKSSWLEDCYIQPMRRISTFLRHGG